MKKTALWFFMAVLCTANVFGAGDVAISRIIPGKNNVEKTDVENTDDASVVRSARRVNVANRTESDKNSSRAATRSTVVKSGDVVSRNAQKTNVVSRGGQKTNTRSTLSDGVNTVGRNPRTESAGINSLPSVRRAGIVLRSSTAEVGGRAKIIGTDTQTGSNIDDEVRSVHGRASLLSTSKKQVTPTAESIAMAKDVLEKTADLNNTCQQQYNECMDQFCAVVDANQKRCSCSANLDKYARVQKAVEDANAELNDVAQKIRYVGLSADEIHAILSATEAELAMSKTRDNTQNRSMLEEIADMIKDPTASTALENQSSTGDLFLDMDFDFSSDSDDLFNLDLFSGSKDISNKRGKDLYKEATKRCKNVLNQCKDAGGTESQITGNYDLAIDKDCIAYEQGLDKLNKQLVSNVRSANLMLQKARLAVMQNNNEYDVKGCVGALENCMLDDMVCGETYLKCMDPTKRYIDENGSVVLGRNIANITAFMENYNNANINDDFIKGSAKDTTCSNGDGACIVNYLMTKIGTGQTVKDGGLCRAVLDKCKQFTYTGNTAKTQKYNPYNDVVINYIQRAMINIKASQAQIIADYAASCIADISTCYNQQINQINSLSTTANVNNIYNIMTGACYNVALTCGYAVFAYDADIGAQVDAAATESERQMILIRAISDLFYQSLLCPNNSTFISSGEQQTSANRTIQGNANTRCKCDEGYAVWGGACLSTCASNEYRNSLGICTTCGEGMVPVNTAGGHTENNTCQASGSSGGGGGLSGTGGSGAEGRI